MWVIASNSYLLTQLFCDRTFRDRDMWPRPSGHTTGEIKAFLTSNCESKAIRNQDKISSFGGWALVGGFLLAMLGCLRVLHIVVLGRMRLCLILCVGTPIIYLLVFGAGLKTSVCLEASRLIGDIVARGMIRHSFVAERKRNVPWP